MNDTRPIGVFDSGVGGLTVVRSLVHQLPGENFIYFGDTAHIPYGNKLRDELFQYARAIIAFLLEQDAKAIVVACGTHSSITLPALESTCPVPLLGVVKSGVRSAIRASKNGRIGIIATQASINSGSYCKNIKEMAVNTQVFSMACPDFVPLVEAGQLGGAEVEAAVRKYVLPLMDEGIDTLVMGCTHYPFLEATIKNYVGPEVMLVDPAMETIEELSMILMDKQIANQQRCGTGEFYVSDNEQSFHSVGSLLLGDLIREVNKISLDWCEATRNE